MTDADVFYVVADGYLDDPGMVECDRFMTLLCARRCFDALTRLHSTELARDDDVRPRFVLLAEITAPVTEALRDEDVVSLACQTNDSPVRGTVLVHATYVSHSNQPALAGQREPAHDAEPLGAF